MQAAMQSTMQAIPDLATIPGRRIGGYRNSAPRRVKLYGLGATGTTIAQAVAARGLPNVAVRTGTGGRLFSGCGLFSIRTFRWAGHRGSLRRKPEATEPTMFGRLVCDLCRTVQRVTTC